MNTENLKLGGIDYDEGIDRFCGNNEMYEKYLVKFTELTLYEDMKKDLEQGNYDDAFEACHKLKAFIGNISIPQVYLKICELTELLRNGVQDINKVDICIEETDLLYKKAKNTIIGEMKNE